MRGGKGMTLAFFAGAFFGACFTFGLLIVSVAIGARKRNRGDDDEK